MPRGRWRGLLVRHRRSTRHAASCHRVVRAGQRVTQIAQARADANPELPEVILHFRNAAPPTMMEMDGGISARRVTELAQRARAVLDVDDTHRDDPRFGRDRGRGNVAGRQVGAEVDHAPPFARRGGADEGRADRMAFAGRRRDQHRRVAGSAPDRSHRLGHDVVDGR